MALKAAGAGILTTIGLLFPLALFSALFWNFWHQDGRPPTPPSWMQIAREAIAAALLNFLYWWWITLPVALAVSYYFFRRASRHGEAPH